MANYSLTEDQSTAILRAINIIQDMASPEPSPAPVLDTTFMRHLSNAEGIIETSNSVKAERYLQKASESLNMMGLIEAADSVLSAREQVAAEKEKVEKEHEVFDEDLVKLLVDYEKGEQEKIREAGFKTALEFIEMSTKEIVFLTGILAERIERLKGSISSALEKAKNSVIIKK